MWLTGVLVSFVLAVWLIIMGLAHLITRYEHSTKSKRMLVMMLVVAGVVAMLIMGNWPTLPRWVSLVLTFILTIPLFTFLAVGTCELWRLRLQSSFDQQLERLEQEELALLQRLDDIRSAVHVEALRLRESQTASRQDEDLAERYRKVVEQWQQGEGVARIRSLRVAEWEEQYRLCSPAELQQKCAELMSAAREAREQGDEDRADMTNVELAVVQLCVQEGAVADNAEASGPERVDRLLNRQEQIGRELAELRAQLSEWKLRKRDFLASRIKL